MKIPKKGNYFRLSEEIRVSLEVLSEMTGSTITEVLEACIRIGKKSVAKQRGLDYTQVLYNIIAKRKILQIKRQGKTKEDPNENTNEIIKMAQTRWIDD